jgi:hypothetical protein
VPAAKPINDPLALMGLENNQPLNLTSDNQPRQTMTKTETSQEQRPALHCTPWRAKDAPRLLAWPGTNAFFSITMFHQHQPVMH